MNRLSRRDFLQVSILTGAATVAAACAPTLAPATAPAEPATATPTHAAPEVVSKYQEAPMLAEKVAAGELPPVDERLSESPKIFSVPDSTGQYGGTWRRSFTGPSDHNGPRKPPKLTLTYYTRDVVLEPFLAESWEINEDASVWTWHLRPGTRWSDGVPFTTDAFRYFWESELGHEQISGQYLPLRRSRYLWTGDPQVLADMELPDDNTVVLRFAHPHPLFAHRMTDDGPYAAGHYLKQFHADFVDQKEIDEQAKEEGLSTWDNLYDNRSQWWINPDKPNLYIWIPVNSIQEELFVMERNPYFWGVDEQGHQLPYIDRVTHRLFDSPDTFNMWIINGEIDFQARHVDIGNYTLFKENEEKGDYKAVFGVGTKHRCFLPNQTTKEPRLREFFQDRGVRIALSHAVNREEMNELAYDGVATPRQYSPLEQSPQYYPKLSNAYLDYDPDKASALLDEAGYAERDNDGFRTFKDGSGDTISIIMESIDPPGTPVEDSAQMLCKYLADIGVKCTYKYFERSLWEEHIAANEFEAAWPRWNDRALLPILSPTIFINQQYDHGWGQAWTLHKLQPDNPNAELPPEDHWMWEIWQLYDQIAIEPHENIQTELFHKILDIWAEELPMIGYLGQLPEIMIVKNGLGNFVPGFPIDTQTRDEHVVGTATLFWDDPSEHT